MSWLTNLLGLNPFMIRLALLALAVAAVFSGGFYSASRWYGAQMVQAKSQYERVRADNAALAQSLKLQNDAVDRLRDESLAREKRAAQALAQAKAHSAPLKLHAQQLLNLPAPLPQHQCDAARALIAQELRGSEQAAAINATPPIAQPAKGTP